MPRFKRNGIHCSRFMTPENKFGEKKRVFVTCTPEHNTVLMLTKLEQAAVERHMEGRFVKDTLADYFHDRFLPEHTAAANLKPSMQRLYLYMFDTIILPRIGKVSLRAIDGPTVYRMVAGLREEMKTTKGSKAGGTSGRAKENRARAGIVSRRYSDQTIRNVVVAINTLLNFAGRVQDLPVVPKIQRPRVDEARKARVYSREETQLLISKARDNDEHLALMLMIDAGLRASEILGLTYAQVDFKSHTIAITQQIYRDTGVQSTKGRHRYPPMSADLEKAIRNVGGIGEGFVLKDPTGAPRTDSWLRHVFVTARRAANLPHARVHDGRHMFASRKAAEGVPATELRELLGHADIRTTQKYIEVVVTQPRSVLDPGPSPQPIAKAESNT